MLNLNGVKLKSVAAQKPQASSEKKKLRQKRCESSADFYRLMAEANMEEYFDEIKHFTFRSEFFALTVEDAKSLREAYKTVDSLPAAERKSFSWSDNKVLLSIAERIDEAKKKLGCEAPQTSSRSPKDAALSEKGVEVYKSALAELKRREAHNPSALSTEENMKLHALYVMGTKALRVTKGTEAVDLLIRSNRLQDDFDQFIEHPSNLYQIAVREFANFEVELEFRAFVWEGKITAITQYNEYVFFPGVVAHKEMLEKLMVEWTNQNLVGKIKLESFVIDLMLVSQTPSEGIYSNLRVYVVEVNPFAEFAGTGLFKWEDEHDADILYGDSPFELRVATKPQKGVIKTIPDDWKHQIDLAEGRV